jgi:hypothetical protein
VSTRLVASTIKDGHVNFNQVVILGQTPDRIALVAIDPDVGVYAWVRAYQDVAGLAATQHMGYSAHIGPVDVSNPPSEFGGTLLIERDWFPPDIWRSLTTTRTQALNRAAIAAFRDLFGLDA